MHTGSTPTVAMLVVTVVAVSPANGVAAFPPMPTLPIVPAAGMRRTGPVVWNGTEVHCHSWRSLLSLLVRNIAGATSHTAERLTAFFTNRVDKIRAGTAAAVPPNVVDTAPALLSSFQLCTEADIDVCRIIM